MVYGIEFDADRRRVSRRARKIEARRQGERRWKSVGHEFDATAGFGQRPPETSQQFFHQNCFEAQPLGQTGPPGERPQEPVAASVRLAPHSQVFRTEPAVQHSIQFAGRGAHPLEVEPQPRRRVTGVPAKVQEHAIEQIRGIFGPVDADAVDAGVGVAKIAE